MDLELLLIALEHLHDSLRHLALVYEFLHLLAKKRIDIVHLVGCPLRSLVRRLQGIQGHTFVAQETG